MLFGDGFKMRWGRFVQDTQQSRIKLGGAGWKSLRTTEADSIVFGSHQFLTTLANNRSPQVAVPVVPE